MTKYLTQLTNPVLPDSIGGGTNPGPNSGGSALGLLIGNLVGVLFIAAILLAFMQLVLGGLNWITAGGDKEKLQHARDKITQAIMGLIVVAASYALASLIVQFFGLDLESLKIPSIGR